MVVGVCFDKRVNGCDSLMILFDYDVAAKVFSIRKK